MITFNTLLVDAGVDPAYVKMARHTERGYQLLDIWRSDRQRFEEYQARQRPRTFAGATHVACFLVSRSGTSVFGGLYAVERSWTAPLDDVDPLTGSVNPGHRQLHTLSAREDFALYEDRLVIDWGPGTRSWVQWAARQPKPIVEIADQQEERWPGWRDFRCTADELASLPRGWRAVLAATRGIYLLVDLDADGARYIGSAKGAESLLGRLEGYADGGTNSNLGLTKGHRYQVTVLEAVGTGLDDRTIESIESAWKDKLQTRRPRGLNWN